MWPLLPRVGRGFISDGGGEGAVVVFDPRAMRYSLLAALPDADGIIFDPSSGYVLVASGRGKALMTFRPDIDVTKGKIDPATAPRRTGVSGRRCSRQGVYQPDGYARSGCGRP